MPDQRPLRVLFVNENVGGHATVHAALRRCFAERDDVAAEFLDAPGPGLLGRVLRAPVPGLAGLDADLQPLRGQLVRSEAVRRALRARLRRGDIDAVHVYTHNCALTSARLLRTVPTVVTTDSTTELNAYRIPYRTPGRGTAASVRVSVPLERRVLGAAHRVLANSGFAADSLRTRYRLPESTVEVLPFGVWLPPEPPGRPAPSDRRPTVVFVGHQLERKGGRRLIEVHQRYLRDRCDLVLVTSERVEPLPGVRVESGVTAGSDRLWEVLSGADVMCFPSTIDQAPNAVLEASAAGLPVVAHPVGAIAEMVRDGVSGLLVPPEDPTALLTALSTLLDDPARAQRMGLAGRAHVRSCYDMRTAADRLVTVLTDAVHAHRASRRVGGRAHAQGGPQ